MENGPDAGSSVRLQRAGLPGEEEAGLCQPRRLRSRQLGRRRKPASWARGVLGEQPGPQPGQRPLRWCGTPNPLAQGAGLGSARVCASSRVLALSCSLCRRVPRFSTPSPVCACGWPGPVAQPPWVKPWPCSSFLFPTHSLWLHILWAVFLAMPRPPVGELQGPRPCSSCLCSPFSITS